MNNNEVFTKVVTHLWNQKVPSINKSGHCMYRGNNGTSCAIGCLITDAEYNPKMEDRPVGRIVTEFELPSLDGVNRSLLTQLQCLHDEVMTNHHSEDDGLNDLDTKNDFLQYVEEMKKDFNLDFDLKTLV